MRKRASKSLLYTAIAILLTAFTAGAVHATGYDDAEGIGQPEYLFFIEGTGSYFLPAAEGEIFFNLGRWYSKSGDSWFAGDDPGGPWSGITVQNLPRDLAELPADFRDTRRLGMIPIRYVTGSEKQDDDYGGRYYTGEYYTDYERLGYRRRWNPHGRFWFFVAPDFHDDDWDDSHRRRRRRRY